MNDRLAKTLRMGIDIHNKKYHVAYTDDNSLDTPAPVEQDMSPDQFLDWVRSQVNDGKKVFSCYEAGPLDCTLHLDLKDLGVVNRLIRHKNWEDENHEEDASKYSAAELLEITCALT